ncbi:MAG: hypothetical protein M3P85_08720, partial [Actinomycetota bacterium]|nr:hypothetical protein [Actinomycetota bacterium]
APRPAGVAPGPPPPPAPPPAPSPAADTSVPPTAPPEVAAPVPVNQERASTGSGSADDKRPWAPLAGATLALAGSATGAVWARRRARSA